MNFAQCHEISCFFIDGVPNALIDIKSINSQFPISGNPPLWITRRSAWLYFNHARVLERNIKLNSDSGEEQMMFIIDSVLEPLLPISAKNATFSQDVTAGKLLEK